ncbi:MAG TPA: SDR family oxidoreductase [Sphingomicrobium sp.]|nr:SDR family oxidoreductase [Sphingomicrobium sp.]
MRFSDKTALITGAASGIGRATATLLAREGARELLLVDLNAAGLADLSLECPAHCHVGDVCDEATWQSDRFSGAIDHAVVNAGIASAAPIDRLTLTEWRRVLSVNLDGAFLTLRAALRTIRKGGSIVVVASAAGIKAEAGTGAYGSSKAAVIQLARVAAKEAAPRDIRVNVIAPAGVETPIWDELPSFTARANEIGRESAFLEMAAIATPLKRFAKPDEIAEQIAFLLSDASRTVTGSLFVTDGGYTL